jgi:CBS domain containing-hemolysin-like protein
MNDMSSQLLLVAVALFLVFLNGFFVASEFSIVKIRGTRIEELVRKGKKRANLARGLVQNMDEYLSATQLGITIASLGLGWIGEPAFAALFLPLLSRFGSLDVVVAHTVAAGLAFLLITFLHIVLGELAPKSMAIQYPEKVILAASGGMTLFYKASYPFIWSLNKAAFLFLRIFGIHPVTELGSAHSEEELRMILAKSMEKGVLDAEEQQLLDRVFSYGDRSARQIMVPAGDVVFMDINNTFEQNMAIARKSGHTRYPLCDRSLGNALGIIHIKDLIWRMPRERFETDLQALKRPILFVPESSLIKDLLPELRKNRTHMSIIIDEFGSPVGIVTMEDILEELVGEIQDEFDNESPALMIEKIGENLYSINGRTLLTELEEYFDIKLEDEENDTVAGLVMTLLGRVANIGDEVIAADSFRIRVEAMNHLQITELSLTRIL